MKYVKTLVLTTLLSIMSVSSVFAAGAGDAVQGITTSDTGQLTDASYKYIMKEINSNRIWADRQYTKNGKIASPLFRLVEKENAEDEEEGEIDKPIAQIAFSEYHLDLSKLVTSGADADAVQKSGNFTKSGSKTFTIDRPWFVYRYVRTLPSDYLTATVMSGKGSSPDGKIHRATIGFDENYDIDGNVIPEKIEKVKNEETGEMVDQYVTYYYIADSDDGEIKHEDIASYLKSHTSLVEGEDFIEGQTYVSTEKESTSISSIEDIDWIYPYPLIPANKSEHPLSDEDTTLKEADINKAYETYYKDEDGIPTTFTKEPTEIDTEKDAKNDTEFQNTITPIITAHYPYTDTNFDASDYMVVVDTSEEDALQDFYDDIAFQAEQGWQTWYTEGGDKPTCPTFAQSEYVDNPSLYGNDFSSKWETVCTYANKKIQYYFEEYRKYYEQLKAYDTDYLLWTSLLPTSGGGEMSYGIFIKKSVYDNLVNLTATIRAHDYSANYRKFKDDTGHTNNFMHLFLGTHGNFYFYADGFVADHTMSAKELNEVKDADGNVISSSYSDILGQVINIERNIDGLKAYEAADYDSILDPSLRRDITDYTPYTLGQNTYNAVTYDYFKDKYTWNFSDIIGDDSIEVSDLGQSWLDNELPTSSSKLIRIPLDDEAEVYNYIIPDKEGTKLYVFTTEGLGDIYYCFHDYFIRPDIHQIDVIYTEPKERTSAEEADKIRGDFLLKDGQPGSMTNKLDYTEDVYYRQTRIKEEQTADGKYLNYFELPTYGTNIEVVRYIDLNEYEEPIQYKTVVDDDGESYQEIIDDGTSLYSRAKLYDIQHYNNLKQQYTADTTIDYIGKFEIPGEPTHHYYALTYSVPTSGIYVEGQPAKRLYATAQPESVKLTYTAGSTAYSMSNQNQGYTSAKISDRNIPSTDDNTLRFCFRTYSPYVGEAYSGVQINDGESMSYETWFNTGKWGKHAESEIMKDKDYSALYNYYAPDGLAIDGTGIDTTAQERITRSKDGYLDIDVDYKAHLCVAFMTDNTNPISPSDITVKYKKGSQAEKMVDALDITTGTVTSGVTSASSDIGYTDYLPNNCITLYNVVADCTYYIDNMRIHINQAVDSDLYYTQYTGNIDVFNTNSRTTFKTNNKPVNYVSDMYGFYLKASNVRPEVYVCTPVSNEDALAVMQDYLTNGLTDSNAKQMEACWENAFIKEIDAKRTDISHYIYSYVVGTSIPATGDYYFYDKYSKVVRKITVKSDNVIINTYYSAFNPDRPLQHVNDEGARLTTPYYGNFTEDKQDWYIYIVISNMTKADQENVNTNIDVNYMMYGEFQTLPMETQHPNSNAYVLYFPCVSPGTYQPMMNSGINVRLNAQTEKMYYGKLTSTSVAGSPSTLYTVSTVATRDAETADKINTVYDYQDDCDLFVAYPYDPVVDVRLTYGGVDKAVKAMPCYIQDNSKKISDGKKVKRWIIKIDNPDAGIYYIGDSTAEIIKRAATQLLSGYTMIKDNGLNTNGELVTDYISNRGTITWFPGLQIFWIDNDPQTVKVAGWDQSFASDNPTNIRMKGVQFFITDTYQIEPIPKEKAVHGQYGSYLHRMTVPYPGTFVRCYDERDFGATDTYNTDLNTTTRKYSTPGASNTAWKEFKSAALAAYKGIAIADENEKVLNAWTISIRAPQRAFIGNTIEYYDDDRIKELADYNHTGTLAHTTAHDCAPNYGVHVAWIAFPELYENDTYKIYKEAMYHDNDWNIDASWLGTKLGLYRTGYYNTNPLKPGELSSLDDEETRIKLDSDLNLGRVYYTFDEQIIKRYGPTLTGTDSPYPGVRPLTADIIMPTMKNMYHGGNNYTYKYILSDGEASFQNDYYNYSYFLYNKDDEKVYDGSTKQNILQEYPVDIYSKANGYHDSASLPDYMVLDKPSVYTTDTYSTVTGEYIDPAKGDKQVSHSDKPAIKTNPDGAPSRIGGMSTETMPINVWTPNVTDTSSYYIGTYKERQPDTVYDLPHNTKGEYVNHNAYKAEATAGLTTKHWNVLAAEPIYDYRTKHPSHMHDVLFDASYNSRNEKTYIQIENYSRLDDDETGGYFTYTMCVNGARNNILQTNHTGIFTLRPEKTMKLTVVVTSPLGARSEYDLNVTGIKDIQQTSLITSETDNIANVNVPADGKLDTTFQDRHYEYYRTARSDVIDVSPIECVVGLNERSTSNLFTVYVMFANVSEDEYKKLHSETYELATDPEGYYDNIWRGKDKKSNVQDRLQAFCDFIVSSESTAKTFEGIDFKFRTKDAQSTKGPIVRTDSYPGGTTKISSLNNTIKTGKYNDGVKNHGHYFNKFTDEQSVIYSDVIDRYVKTMANTNGVGEANVKNWWKLVLGQYWLNSDNKGEVYVKNLDTFTNFNTPTTLYGKSYDDVVIAYVFSDESNTFVQTAPHKLSDVNSESTQNNESSDFYFTSIPELFVNQH